jgi:hypothetical protein
MRAKNKQQRLDALLWIEKATEGNRTLDPPLTKRLLCRLSYGGGKIASPIIQGKCSKSKVDGSKK